uniref:Glucosylceramidase n=1 Tax=Ditylenchus dipsaci TaxID=166011 RepID=A0A915EMS8_9BILA
MNKTNWYILDALFLVSICGGIAFLSIHYSNSTECRKRYFTASDIDSRALDSFVCVCSGSICDEPKPLGDLAQGATIVVYRSSDRKIPSVTIAVDNSRKYQKIFGFGGAFTDAAGINMKSLSETTQQTLMEAYFGDKDEEIKSHLYAIQWLLVKKKIDDWEPMSLENEEKNEEENTDSYSDEDSEESEN